ncbi:MAG: MgtC/SapB family protein [Candidatus Kerfeldbacteria bacterium]
MDIQFVIIIQMLLAGILGGLIGFERRAEHKEAGIRTHALVTIGSALFTGISLHALNSYAGFDNVDISRIMAQIVVGIGFLGAGIIIFTGERVHGLTTAAGIWVSSAIGMAVGVQWYWVAVIGTVIVVFLLWFVRRVFPAPKSYTYDDDD